MVPAGPFPEELVVEMTGIRFGCPEIRPPSL
jgi:hypothetical protein